MIGRRFAGARSWSSQAHVKLTIFVTPHPGLARGTVVMIGPPVPRMLGIARRAVREAAFIFGRCPPLPSALGVRLILMAVTAHGLEICRVTFGTAACDWHDMVDDGRGRFLARLTHRLACKLGCPYLLPISGAVEPCHGLSTSTSSCRKRRRSSGLVIAVISMFWPRHTTRSKTLRSVRYRTNT